MGTLLAEFAASGIQFERTADGSLCAFGPLTDCLRVSIREHKLSILTELCAANDAMSRHWRITLPERAPFSVAVTPPADAAAMLHLYPGATVEPIAERRRPATPVVEVEELRQLIGIILHDDPEARAEALSVAMADAGAALDCYRTLAAASPNRQWTKTALSKRTCCRGK